ncbi:GGDEF domain-containing protein [Bacillus sp. EB01]|uniref:GGDEF domain-containing protein n=1 Tax=Bacillus sp. EB01 TaxID=1347086 RepID=UPI0005C58563|nr:GGDEF domain-containing protein [Bacillus sp. EB01]
MQTMIGEIAEKVLVVPPSVKCEDVYGSFKEDPSLEGIVVVKNNQPLGLVMKTQFYQKLSAKYGFDLFIKRTVDLVMNKNPLIVEYSLPISKVSSLAMKRSQENLYDYVIVTLEGSMFGIVSIKNLLIKMAEIQVEIARYSNPLTGLPGNHGIKEALSKALNYDKYTIFYLDINSFKVFNDTYGFKWGDEVIRKTAVIISDAICKEETSTCFVGHIGGDDFIGIVPYHDYISICTEIINRFDSMARVYYSEEELERGYVMAVNRRGKLEDTPLMGISIAVMQNKSRHYSSVDELSKQSADLKQRCKAMKKSVYLTLEDCEKAHLNKVTPV